MTFWELIILIIVCTLCAGYIINFLFRAILMIMTLRQPAAPPKWREDKDG